MNENIRKRYTIKFFFDPILFWPAIFTRSGRKKVRKKGRKERRGERGGGEVCHRAPCQWIDPSICPSLRNSGLKAIQIARTLVYVTRGVTRKVCSDSVIRKMMKLRRYPRWKVVRRNVKAWLWQNREEQLGLHTGYRFNKLEIVSRYPVIIAQLLINPT